MRVEGLQLLKQRMQRPPPLPVRQFWSHPIPTPAQLLDGSHGVMDGPNLCLHLGQQIQLLQNEEFGVRFKGEETRGAGVIRHRAGRITALKIWFKRSSK